MIFPRNIDNRKLIRVFSVLMKIIYTYTCHDIICIIIMERKLLIKSRLKCKLVNKRNKAHRRKTEFKSGYSIYE